MKYLIFSIFFIILTIGCLNHNNNSVEYIRIEFVKGTTYEDVYKLMTNNSITDYNIHTINKQNDTSTYNIIVVWVDAKKTSNKEDFINKMNNESIVSLCKIEIHNS